MHFFGFKDETGIIWLPPMDGGACPAPLSKMVTA
jgi:hypothetical protein